MPKGSIRTKRTHTICVNAAVVVQKVAEKLEQHSSHHSELELCKSSPKFCKRIQRKFWSKFCHTSCRKGGLKFCEIPKVFGFTSLLNRPWRCAAHAKHFEFLISWYASASAVNHSYVLWCMQSASSSFSQLGKNCPAFLELL